MFCCALIAALQVDEELLLSSDSEVDSDEILSEPDTDDDGEEAERKRELLRKRARNKLEQEKRAKMLADLDYSLDHEHRHEHEPRIKKIMRFVKGVQRTIYRKTEPHRAKYLKLKKRLRHAVDVAEIRTRKIMLKVSGQLDEIQKEMAQEMRQQYIAFEMTTARRKAEREFSVIESIRQTWGGLALEVCFFFC